MGWTPIGAVQTASGYDVAWKNPASGLFTIWMTDSNGTYISNTVNVPGNNIALENFETIFNQDLNGDSIVGPPPLHHQRSSRPTDRPALSRPEMSTN